MVLCQMKSSVSGIGQLRKAPWQKFSSMTSCGRLGCQRVSVQWMRTIVALLVFCSFETSRETTGAMLQTIQDMKIFLRTAFVNLTEFAGLMVDIKTQGLCQSNGAALAGWTVVSIVILNAHKQWGHGTKFLCPICLVHSNLSAILFVDDTNVIHLDMNRRESHLEALEGLEQSIMSWGKLLIGTGGSLKPSKCWKKRYQPAPPLGAVP
jgi:hypothetical protein